MTWKLLALSCFSLAGFVGFAQPATAHHVLVSCEGHGSCEVCGHPTHDCHPCQPPGGCGNCGGDHVCECSTDPQCIGSLQYGMTGPVSFCVGASVNPSDAQEPVKKWHWTGKGCTAGGGGSLPIPIGVPVGPFGGVRMGLYYELP